MSLETYRAKRNFRRTPEPSGKKRSAKTTGHSFVVQKHAARQLHYDFRLEQNGVLLSWAVPKGPSLDPADKRLAMHVEDHPIEYGGFEGVIPEGEYGGGTVMVWDRGTWTPEGDPVAGYAKGELKFTLNGEKLKGGWVLVRTRGSKYGGKSGDKAWLLIKEKDAFAAPSNGAIVEAAPDSVVTGRTIEQIASAKKHVWRSKLSVGENVRAGAIVSPSTKATKKRVAKASLASVEGAKKAAMPATVAPVLTTLVDHPPAGDEWINEIKYDGYRMVCRIESGRARLISRNGNDWTRTFPEIAKDLARLPVKQAWVDGEVVVLDAEGRSSFQALQNALTGTSTRGLAFFVFDLMYRDGYDLRGAALRERKMLLREIVGEGVGTVRIGPEMQGRGDAFFEQACKLRLEGAICKKADSRYAGGTRTREWVKVKCTQRQEMVIAGFTDPQGSREGFGALLLGYYDDGKLRYSGKVGTGFNDEFLRKLLPELKKREQPEPAFVNPPRGYAAKGAHWVAPDLVAEISFTEWSNDGALRHPSFMGLRPDKKASEVTREKAVKSAADAEPDPKSAAVAKSPTKAPSRKKRASATPDVAPDAADTLAGVTLSHPEKKYFPEAGLTKGDLAQYYVGIAPHLLPHIIGRPLALVRCPDGWRGQCFYQKHADRAVNKAVARVEVRESKGKATYLGADSATALAGLVQWGVIEMHPWGSRTPRLDRPDRIVFDFDPDDKLPWKELVIAVGLLRSMLDEMKLVGFLKTTGGKGLHVVLPIRPTLSWDEGKSFAKAVADFLVRTFPDRFIATMNKEKRKGKIFIDYLRNSEGATAIAPYAVRARANAPVATPIDWSELTRDVRFEYFNIRNVPQRLARMRSDPWAKFLTTQQTITAAMRKRLD